MVNRIVDHFTAREPRGAIIPTAEITVTTTIETELVTTEANHMRVACLIKSRQRGLCEIVWRHITKVNRETRMFQLIVECTRIWADTDTSTNPQRPLPLSMTIRIQEVQFITMNPEITTQISGLYGNKDWTDILDI